MEIWPLLFLISLSKTTIFTLNGTQSVHTLQAFPSLFCNFWFSFSITHAIRKPRSTTQYFSFTNIVYWYFFPKNNSILLLLRLSSMVSLLITLRQLSHMYDKYQGVTREVLTCLTSFPPRLTPASTMNGCPSKTWALYLSFRQRREV